MEDNMMRSLIGMKISRALVLCAGISSILILVLSGEIHYKFVAFITLILTMSLVLGVYVARKQ